MKKLLILIILSLLLLSSCAKLESAGFELGEKLGSKMLDEDQEEESVDYFCYEKAKKLQCRIIT